MIARDQNGLEFEVSVDAGGVLHGPYADAYIREPGLDDDESIAWVDPAQRSDVVFTSRCECENALIAGILSP